MIGHNNAIEIGFELMYLRNIEVEKIDFLRVKQSQYLAECRMYLEIGLKLPHHNGNSSNGIFKSKLRGSIPDKVSLLVFPLC